MNERIKELYLHAFPPSLNDSTIVQMSAEKFAELIVRECLLVTKKQYNDTLPWGGVEDTIKEHFGVE